MSLRARTRNAFGAALVVLLVGCSSAVPGTAAPTTGEPSWVPVPDVAGAPAPGVSGAPVPGTTEVSTGPASTGYPLEGHHLRVVRVGTDDMALQFDMVNTGQEEIRSFNKYDWVPRFFLVDLPRGTAYRLEDRSHRAVPTRISDSISDALIPNKPVTYTGIYPAPPPEARQLLVIAADLQPVLVPIEPAGAPLKDDDVLRTPKEPGDYSRGLSCGTRAPSAVAGPSAAVEYRLPSDVLFDFDKATLTPAATGVLEELVTQIQAKDGTVTVTGHTDAIGTDAYNQTLSEQRAAAVRDALRATLGGAFAYQAVGLGKTQPLAPNTHPDGTDDPDGRAQNRRVEIHVGTTAQAPPTVEPPELSTGLRDKGMKITATSARRLGTYLLVTVDIHNPTSADIKADVTAPPFVGGGAQSAHGIVVFDPIGRQRHLMCDALGKSSRIELGNQTLDYSRSGDYAPGSTVHLQGIYTAPAAAVTSVDIEVDGFGAVLPTAITN